MLQMNAHTMEIVSKKKKRLSGDIPIICMSYYFK